MTLPQTTVLLKAIAFAADKHRHQLRKDAGRTPYINHPIRVAITLATRGGITDENLLVAALLHDTIEDTETTADELEAQFGREVMELVMEVTDNKSLTVHERKRLQVLHAASKSDKARQLKMADKICNIEDVTFNPPASWPIERRLAYLSWAEDVFAGLKGINPGLEAAFTHALHEGRQHLKELLHFQE